LPCPLGLDTDLSLGDLRFLALPPLRLPKVTLLELLTAFATFLFSFSHDYLPFILSTIDHTAPTTVNAPPITAVTIPSSKRPLATTIPPTKVSTCLTIPKIVSLFIVLGFYYLQDFFDCAGFDILTITDFPLGVDVFFTATFMSFDLPYFMFNIFCNSKITISNNLQ
jgi:hypothetical protein